MKNSSQHPCPICGKQMFIVGKDVKGKTLTSCGHVYKFKRSKSQKMAERKYIQTAWGLEKVES